MVGETKDGMKLNELSDDSVRRISEVLERKVGSFTRDTKGMRGDIKSRAIHKLLGRRPKDGTIRVKPLLQLH